MKEQNKTRNFILALFFGALCFGAGVFFGQHLLVEKGFVYEEGAAEKDVSSLPEEGDTAVSRGKININTASAAALCGAEGIGSVTADKIVSSREEEGRFEEVYDLVTRGIMVESKYHEVEPFLTAE